LLQLADDQHVMKIVHIEGKEHVESALRKGKRAIPQVLDWEYPDQWNWLTVRLNKHHLDRTPDLWRIGGEVEDFHMFAMI
jgi:lauroyl/myristoyl acyltransferase